MKLCDILAFIGSALALIGMGGVCGAIEGRGSLVWSLVFLAAGAVIFCLGYKEYGGHFDA